jgi:hypothetical protein
MQEWQSRACISLSYGAKLPDHNLEKIFLNTIVPIPHLL